MAMVTSILEGKLKTALEDALNYDIKGDIAHEVRSRHSKIASDFAKLAASAIDEYIKSADVNINVPLDVVTLPTGVALTPTPITAPGKGNTVSPALKVGNLT